MLPFTQQNKLRGLLQSAVTVSLNFLPSCIICVQQSHAAKLLLR